MGSRLPKIKNWPPTRTTHYTAAIQHQEPNSQDEEEDEPPEEKAPKRHVENAEEDKGDEQQQAVDRGNIRDDGATEDGSSFVDAEGGISQTRKLGLNDRNSDDWDEGQLRDDNGDSDEPLSSVPEDMNESQTEKSFNEEVDGDDDLNIGKGKRRVN